MSHQIKTTFWVLLSIITVIVLLLRVLNSKRRFLELLSSLNLAIELICSQCNLSLPPENISKPYSFLMFSGGRESVRWEQMG